MYEVIAQLIGYLGAAFLIMSFQIKNEKKFFLCQCLGSGLFLINYLMLTAWTGVLISIMSVTRSALAPYVSGKKRYVLIPLVLLIPIIAGFFIYQGIQTILMIVAYCIFTVAMFTKNSKLIRVTQLTVASPLQLAHNIIVSSQGGIICESFNIVSIIVSFFRIGFKNFQKTGESNNEK
jgi:hypothetical protein